LRVAVQAARLLATWSSRQLLLGGLPSLDTIAVLHSRVYDWQQLRPFQFAEVFPNGV